ncbi:hypothetical protein E2C01_102066 [Portunus trituberculatus]|uniref:Uncharacterized protein n=1 Tax=Portunus trituberculatus TaxID=210409 RepID=A0A5B7K755_PORTR|nr:hypothetical protein [Portunus trituberculatus]
MTFEVTPASFLPPTLRWLALFPTFHPMTLSRLFHRPAALTPCQGTVPPFTGPLKIIFTRSQSRE